MVYVRILTLRPPRKKFWDFPASCSHPKKALNASKLAKISLNQPLANFPIKCEYCDTLVYRYALEDHVQKEHPGQDVPGIAVISADEKNLVLGKNFQSKLPMQVPDMKKLKDSEIALFPLSDFWDRKASQWKSSKMGAWAKANSVKMKRIYGAESFE